MPVKQRRIESGRPEVCRPRMHRTGASRSPVRGQGGNDVFPGATATVARQQPAAFQRVFPIRDYLRGSARAAVLWSAAGSILLCLLLFTLYQIGDLLTTGGVLRVQTGLGDQVYERLGERPNTTDRGLLPAVWWGRDKVR